MNLCAYSDGNRYTASADTLTSSIYENGDKIDPTTNKIKVEQKAEVSSGVSSSSNKTSSSKKTSSTTKKKQHVREAWAAEQDIIHVIQ